MLLKARGFNCVIAGAGRRTERAKTAAHSLLGAPDVPFLVWTHLSAHGRRLNIVRAAHGHLYKAVASACRLHLRPRTEVSP